MFLFSGCRDEEFFDVGGPVSLRGEVRVLVNVLTKGNMFLGAPIIENMLGICTSQKNAFSLNFNSSGVLSSGDLFKRCYYFDIKILNLK